MKREKNTSKASRSRIKDNHDDEIKQEEEEEGEEKEIDDNPFQNDKPLKVSINLVVTWQLIACGAGFILDHSLVPNEGHATFIPALSSTIESLLRRSTKFIDKLQIRTDGIDVNRNAPEKALTDLYNKYYNSDTGESILRSKYGPIYDLAQWIKDGRCKVCILYIYSPILY